MIFLQNLLQLCGSAYLRGFAAYSSQTDMIYRTIERNWTNADECTDITQAQAEQLGYNNAENLFSGYYIPGNGIPISPNVDPDACSKLRLCAANK